MKFGSLWRIAPPRRRSGFTLPEMVLVIALLLLLLTLMLPTLSKSRAHSIQLKCMAHLRQVGVFTQNHVEDNDDRYPYMFLQMVRYKKGAFSAWMTPRNSIDSGMRWFKQESMLCPADSYPTHLPMLNGSGAAEPVKSSFGMNVGSTIYDIRFWKMQELVNPSDYVTFFDGTMGADAQGSYYSLQSFMDVNTIIRHPLGINVLYADGHVEHDTETFEVPGDKELTRAQGSLALKITRTNNGHGNNADGVDTSNPGNAPMVDGDSSVDDEGNGNAGSAGGGSGGGGGGNGNANGNGNGNGK